MGGLRCGGLRRLDIRPDQMRVVGPQVAAGDGAACGALDGQAVLDGNLTAGELPLTNGGSRDTK